MSERVPSIQMKDVTVRFREEPPCTSMRAALRDLGRRTLAIARLRQDSVNRWFWALRGITLTIYENETVGLIGLNGAGKSTLMQTMSGIYCPTTGEVNIDGRVTGLLGINMGFVPKLTGRGNILLTGLLLGMSESRMNELLPEIIEFAQLEDAIDRPVKNYSSGMRSRLGFAIISTLEPDILLLDEVMSVGDGAFRQQCRQRIERMMAMARTIVICSHNMELIRSECNRTAWIDHGKVRAIGPTDEIVQQYEAFLQNEETSRSRPLKKAG